MSDQPAQPATPDEEQRETVTTPAGGVPPVPMRTPKHGHGKLLTRGQPGNKGGGRHPEKLVAQYSNVLGVTVDEFERRCRDPAYLASLTIDELRLVWQALSPYVMPRRYEHAGVGGGPLVLEIDAVRNATVAAFRERLDRLRGLKGPAPEAATPPPETPLGVANAVL